MSATLPPPDLSKPPRTAHGHGWLLTSLGALLVAGILIAVNWFFSLTSSNFDFTENRVHTLSDGTRNILKRVDTDVTIKLFVSPMDDMQPQFRPVVQQVEGWLERYHELSPNFVKVQKFEVQPASDEEQAAAAAGIEPQGGRMYFGISVTCLDKTSTIPFVPALMAPFIDQDRIEFGLSGAITEVITSKKKVVGLMTALPITGNAMPFGGRSAPPWAIYEGLKSQYEVKTVELGTTKIDDDISVLVMLHPAGITDEAQWAVDQYLLKGGHVIAFLDPYSLIASQSGQQGMPPGMGGGGIPVTSNLSKLLGAWGYTLEDKLVADLGYATAMGPNYTNPLLPTLSTDAVNKTSDITKQLSDFWLVYPGAFSGSPASGLTENILLTTSPKVQMVDLSNASSNPGSQQAMMQVDRLKQNFISEGKKRILAFQLSGKFKTAFPNGKPDAPPPTPPQGGGGMNGLPPGLNFGGPQGEAGQPGTPAEPAAAAPTPAPAVPAPAPVPPATPAPAPAAVNPPASPAPAAPPAATPAPVPAPPAETPAPAPAPAPAETADPLLPPPATGGATPPVAAAADPSKPESLKEGTKDGLVFLVSDTDMLADMLTRQILQNSNIPFAQNLVDQAAGDQDLMSIRSRGSSRRPFDTLNNIQAAAEEKIKGEMQQMNAEVEKLNRDISTQKSAKDRNNALFAGLRNMELKQREINLKIYEKQKEARKEYQAQEDKIKWMNVLLMPLLVAAIGILIWIIRKIKTSAR